MTGAIQTVPVNGYSMAWVEDGTGVPVVLVHGTLADYRYWSPQMGPLAEHCRAIAVSLRHHHPEAWDGVGSTYTCDQHVDDLAAFLEAVANEPVHLVGHSRGGQVALRMALAHPHLVRSLTLADPAVSDGRTAADTPAAAQRRAAIERIRTGETEAGLEAFVDTVSGPGIWQKMNSRRKQYARDNVRTLIGQADDASGQVGDALLAELELPLLLIGGEKSPPPYPDVIARIAACVPGAAVAQIPGASHSMNAEHPAAFNRVLLDFIGTC